MNVCAVHAVHAVHELTEAFDIFQKTKKTAEDEVSFYSSSAYQCYYEYHFKKSYEEYSSYTYEELDDEEEILNNLRTKSASVLHKIHIINGLGFVEYKMCCELDAELDAVHAAYRRCVRSNSI